MMAQRQAAAAQPRVVYDGLMKYLSTCEVWRFQHSGDKKANVSDRGEEASLFFIRLEVGQKCRLSSS